MTTTMTVELERPAFQRPTYVTAQDGPAVRAPHHQRLLHLHWDWWREQLAPVLHRARVHGLLRAAPVSLMLALGTLLVTGLVRIASPVQDAAYAIFAYRGLDLWAGEVWSLPLSGLLSQSWPQWAWTVFVAGVVFAPLEVRIGGRMVLACVFSSQVASTAVVGLLAPWFGHADLLTRPDFGTSCLVVGAAAALAWVRRSVLLTVVIALSLTVDAFLSAPATAVEHCVAVTVGALSVMAVRRRRRPPTAQSGDVFDD
jgi:hypothetical protein